MSRFAAVERDYINRHGFYAFVKAAWHVVEKAPYVDNWHIEENCLHAQAITETLCLPREKRTRDWQLTDLVVNEPPGCSKSLIWSVLWHPWSWTKFPHLRYMCASFDPSLALKHTTLAFDLLTSDWYIQRWGNLLEGCGPFAMGEYDNKHGGFRFATSVGGRGTGRHGHVRIVDDPIKPADVEGTDKFISATLTATNQWWRGTFSSRKADWNNFASVMVMQRLHQADPTATFLEEGAEHLCLPMRFSAKEASRTSVGGDRRTVEGELLNPIRMPEEAVAKAEIGMGGADGAIAQAQLQQRPAPPGGLVFKSENFQEFTTHEYPYEDSYCCISVDCAFKDVESQSGVGIEVWGMIGGKLLCYDSVLETLGFSDTIEAIYAVLLRFPKVQAILVEEKANGAACIELLRKRFPNIVPMIPKTSKRARAQAANVFYQAKSVYHLAGALWLNRKESNLKLYPKGRRCDDVDTTTQATLWLMGQNMQDFSDAMAQFKTETKDGSWQNILQQHFSTS